MEYLQLIKGRYSCRKYSQKKVGLEILYEIIGEALNAPSAKNTQPWLFYVTNTQVENEKVRVCLQDEGKNKFLDGAAAFIVVFENMPDNIACEKFGNDKFVKYDVGEVAAYLTLSAKNKGVDTCVIGWINEEKLQKNTGIDKPCGMVIALGYAASDAIKPDKKRIGIKDKILNYQENIVVDKS